MNSKITSDIYTHIRGFLPQVKAYELFNDLCDEVDWCHVGYEKPYGMIRTPRLTRCYGHHDWNNPELNGFDYKPEGWTDKLIELRAKIGEFYSHDWNFVLCNYYRDGNDSITWHSDDERFLGSEPAIASVSLGDTRVFKLRNKKTREVIKTELNNGDLFIMHGRCQHDWEHCIAKNRTHTDPRINLTFRKAINQAGSENYYKYNVGYPHKHHELFVA